MIKRIIALFLTLCLLLTLAACTRIVPTNPDDLPRTRKSTGAETAYFAAKDSNTALSIRMPMQWEFDGSGGSFTIKEDGNDVGTVKLGAIEVADEEMTEVKSETKNGVLIKTFIGVLEKDGEKASWYRISYQYDDDEGKSHTITFEVEESAMDSQLYEWLYAPKPQQIKDYHKLPSISLDGGNGKKSIALFGNSFLFDGYSGIDIILEDMMTEAGRSCGVSTTAIGGATITSYATFADSQYKSALSKIKNGTYGIVFMCGLYYDSDVEDLQTIYDACKSSNTQLVLFPAHNENSPQLENALAKYPDLTCLNWRDELDRLIAQGVAKSDLCEKDGHSHSKALAGYVGARMIYKSLFGEEPPALSSRCSVISQQTVNEKLGLLLTKPPQLIPQKKICYLK